MKLHTTKQSDVSKKAIKLFDETICTVGADPQLSESERREWLLNLNEQRELLNKELIVAERFTE